MPAPAAATATQHRRRTEQQQEEAAAEEEGKQYTNLEEEDNRREAKRARGRDGAADGTREEAEHNSSMGQGQEVKQREKEAAE